MLGKGLSAYCCAHAALCCSLCLSGNASALPDALRDADYHLGTGVQLGEHLLLQPTGEIRVGLDTNYLQNSGLTQALFPDEPKPGGTRFSVIPGLTLRSPVPERLRSTASTRGEAPERRARDPYEEQYLDDDDAEDLDDAGDELPSDPDDEPTSNADPNNTLSTWHPEARAAVDSLSPWYGFRLDLEGGFHAIQAESGENASALSSHSHFFGRALAKAEALPNYFVGADVVAGVNRYQEPGLLPETNSAYHRSQTLQIGRAHV